MIFVYFNEKKKILCVFKYVLGLNNLNCLPAIAMAYVLAILWTR